MKVISTTLPFSWKTSINPRIQSHLLGCSKDLPVLKKDCRRKMIPPILIFLSWKLLHSCRCNTLVFWPWQYGPQRTISNWFTLFWILGYCQAQKLLTNYIGIQKVVAKLTTLQSHLQKHKKHIFWHQIVKIPDQLKFLIILIMTSLCKNFWQDQYPVETTRIWKGSRG